MVKRLDSRERQWPLCGYYEFDVNDTVVNGGGNEQPAKQNATFVCFRLPPDAVLTRVTINVLTPSNDSGTPSIQMRLLDSDSTGLISPQDMKTAARISSDLLNGKAVVGGQDIIAIITNGAQDATEGFVRLEIEYYILYRANEVQTH